MAYKFNQIRFGKGNVAIAARTTDIKAYLSAISQYEVLSAEKETELAWLSLAGDQQARETLIKCNLRSVVSIVKAIYADFGGCLSLMDLISAGNIGLIKAVERYNPSMGFKLISFAVNYIRGSIINEIQTNSRIVRDRTKDAPINHVSLDMPAGEDSDTALSDIICTSTDKDTSFEDSLSYDVKRVIKTILSERESDIICMMYGIGTPVVRKQDIAERLGLSGERIRTMEFNAMQKLRGNQHAIALLKKYVA